MHKCIQCGQTVPEEQQVCPHCGVVLAQHSPHQPPISAITPMPEQENVNCPASPEDPPLEPPALSPTPRPFCVECGVELSPGSNFCPICGAKQHAPLHIPPQTYSYPVPHSVIQPIPPDHHQNIQDTKKAILLVGVILLLVAIIGGLLLAQLLPMA